MIDLPPVVGDPAAIHAFAGELRGLASQLEGFEAEVTSAPASMAFEGPAADQFADLAQSLGQRIGSAAEQLRALAGRVDAAAEEVARRIEERRRLLEQLARERAEAMAAR